MENTTNLNHLSNTVGEVLSSFSFVKRKCSSITFKHQNSNTAVVIECPEGEINERLLKSIEKEILDKIFVSISCCNNSIDIIWRNK